MFSWWQTLKIGYFIFESNQSEDRKLYAKNIKAQLSNLEMIDSDTIMISSASDLKKYRNDIKKFKFWPETRLGAIGLFLGTKLAYESAIRSGLDYLVVFEDDFIIADDFYNKLITVMEQKEDFDLISLGYHINPEQAVDTNIPDDLIVPAVSHKPWNAKIYSYVVSKSAMENFLSYIDSNKVFPVDVMFFETLVDEKIYKPYCINPHKIFFGDVNNVDDYGHTILELSHISTTSTIKLNRKQY